VFIIQVATIFTGLDSVELIMEVEKQFSISIPDPEAEKADTLGKPVYCVANILAAKSYDLTLREKTFSLFKTELQNFRRDQADFSIYSTILTGYFIDANENKNVLLYYTATKESFSDGMTLIDVTQ